MGSYTTCVWLLPLSIVFSRLIHIVACVSALLPGTAESYFCMRDHIHPLTDVGVIDVRCFTKYILTSSACSHAVISRTACSRPTRRSTVRISFFCMISLLYTHSPKVFCLGPQLMIIFLKHSENIILLCFAFHYYYFLFLKV